MRVTVATAFFVAALALGATEAMGAGPAEPAGAGARAKAEARLVDVLQGLRNLTQPQLDHMKEEILHLAEQVSLGIVEQLKKLMYIDEAMREELNAIKEEMAKKEAEAAPGAGAGAGAEASGRSIITGGGDGDSEPFVDTVRRVILEGLPSRGIPPLDPFKIAALPNIDLDLPEVLWLKANLSDLALTGISAFEENVNVDMSIGLSVTVTVTFDVLLPNIHLRTLYYANGYADAGLDIWGDGPINIDINRLRVKGNVDVRGSILGISVPVCDIAATSRSFKLEIEGLFGGGLLSQLAGEIVSDMINEYVWEYLFTTISSVVEGGVCGYLRSYISALTLSDLIALLLKITSAPYP